MLCTTKNQSAWFGSVPTRVIIKCISSLSDDKQFLPPYDMIIKLGLIQCCLRYYYLLFLFVEIWISNTWTVNWCNRFLQILKKCFFGSLFEHFARWSIYEHSWNWIRVNSLSADKIISVLLIQEMIINNVDKKWKLAFLLFMFMRVLFYSSV